MIEVPRFTCGFLFSEDRKNLALIHKTKPLWQKDKLNGIGGKIEPGETPLETQIREFTEETGVYIDQWQYMVKFYRERSFEVHFFRAFSDDINNVATLTDERIVVLPARKLPHNALFNLRWLVPLCLDNHVNPPIEVRGS